MSSAQILSQPPSQIYQQSQLSSLIPLNKLFPANQLLQSNVKVDTNIKIIMNDRYQKQREMILKQSFQKEYRIFQIKQLYQKVCFFKEETLGYYFQNLFLNKLIYARLFDKNNISQWIKILSYQPSLDNKVKEKGNKDLKDIKYLAGLFTRQYNSLKNQQLKYQNKQSHILDNNLGFLSNQKQKNFFPQIISFNASYPTANLMYVFRTDINQFSLILHNDTNSKGSIQWFNFTMNLPQKHCFSQIKLNIVNMVKSSSVFKKGMKVLFKHKKQIYWKRLDSVVQYKNNIIDIQGRQGYKYKTLSFIYKTKSTKTYKVQQSIAFAYGYPYGLEQNYKFWGQIEKFHMIKGLHIKNKTNIKKQIIGKSFVGLQIQAYKINFEEKQKSFSTTLPLSNYVKTINVNQTKSIVFLARQHPGQCQGSFIIQGIVNYLASTQLMCQTKKSFTYYIIPIVNPEGVILGNYRTNINGYDLNRNWRNPTIQSQPEIFSIKKYLQKINKEGQICLIMDLHGHSKALNSFFYGVQKIKNYENHKLFPFYCSKRLKQISYKQCHFHVSEDKKNTLRAVVSQLYPKALVYTLQSSFYGYEIKQQLKTKIIQYTPTQLRKLGCEIITTYLQFISSQNFGNTQFKQNLVKQIENYQKNIKKEQQRSLSWIQSDSEAEQQLIDFVNTNKLQKQDEKRKLSLQNKQHNIKQKYSTITRFHAKKPQYRRQKNIVSCKTQGKYLPTIYMIETTRSQLKQTFFHKIYNNMKQLSQIKLAQRRKIIRNPAQRKKQKQNRSKQHNNQSTIMLSINTVKAQQKQQAINKPISKKLNTKTKKNQYFDNITFMNQRQIAFEKIKKRRVQSSIKNNMRHSFFKSLPIKSNIQQKQHIIHKQRP